MLKNRIILFHPVVQVDGNHLVVKVVNVFLVLPQLVGPGLELGELLVQLHPQVGTFKMCPYLSFAPKKSSAI